MQKLVLLPYPKKVDLQNGSFSFTSGDCILLPESDKEILYFTARRMQGLAKAQLKLTLPLMVNNRGMYRDAITFVNDNACAEEGYRIEILAERIIIGYRGGAGAFHAISTLKQLIIQCGKTLPCLVIEDAPDFKARGIMLDISRDKIPTMETLYETIDLMADLKMNELQLYIEGFSFAYATYPFVWEHGMPVTGEEIMALDNYCKQRYIELVPCQNSFGHMGPWLERKEFNALADCPDGYAYDWMPGVIHKPHTLDPSMPESLELIAHLTADLLPYFTSNLFNVCCDETVLGLGKSKALCEKVGKGQVYLDFLLGVYQIVKANGKRMMFWGDIMIKSPELIDKLPKDSIALEWGYEAHHRYKENAIKFRDAGIDFYVCPGTSSWCSFAGRTDNMQANLLNAAVHGKMNGAIGYLITDWGDSGHWQYPGVSYPGFAYGAALSWGVEENSEVDLSAFLNLFIFEDRANLMGQFVMALGNYYLKSNNPVNGTTVSYMLDGMLEDATYLKDIAADDFTEIKNHVLALEAQLNETQMTCKHAELYDAEYRNAIRFIVLGCNVGLIKLRLAEMNEITSHVEQTIEDIAAVISRHERLWLSRNRFGGLNQSVKQLHYLKDALILSTKS